MSLITEPFKIRSEHLGVKYTIEEGLWESFSGKPQRPRLMLHTWYELTKEYIFESTVSSEEDAKQRIAHLVANGFI
jgi:hypothetical protein